ncbi:MAG: flagellar biosynthetic protein FliR [Deltaproteobacteria bacterium]|nr:flagellar biosynthetic protein FliR [Deltaproteobacteria bacterium]
MPGLILQMEHFFLVVIRVGCILFFLPIWDSRLVPAQIRIYSILVISLALTPAVAGALPPFPQTWLAAAGLVLRELLLGLSLGLVVRYVFSGIQMAGELMGIQMGFGMVTLVDPQSGIPTTLMSDLLMLTATVLFLSVDGHHLLLAVLAQSFGEVPVGGPAMIPGSLFAFLVPLGSLMFQLSVKLVAPIILVLFLTQIAMGLVARTVPQVQVMILAFPVTIILGLVFLSLTLMLIGPFLVGKFSWFKGPLFQVLRAWHG